MRDAEPAEFPSTRYPRIEPRHPDIWLRVDGRWHEAYISKWVHDRANDRWLIWTFRQGGGPHSEHGWFVFDPATVRQRERGDTAPGA